MGKLTRRTAVLVLTLLVCLSAPAAAQEGHPLSGSWHGDWGTSASQRTPVLFYLKWNSKEIEGTINPGPHAIPIKVAALDASNWTVHFEADSKDASGNPVHIVIDGKLNDIGSYHRTISGTWMQGGVQADFKLTRD